VLLEVVLEEQFVIIYKLSLSKQMVLLHSFNGQRSMRTWASRYQSRTILSFGAANDSGGVNDDV